MLGLKLIHVSKRGPWWQTYASYHHWFMWWRVTYSASYFQLTPWEQIPVKDEGWKIASSMSKIIIKQTKTKPSQSYLPFYSITCVFKHLGFWKHLHRSRGLASKNNIKSKVLEDKVWNYSWWMFRTRNFHTHIDAMFRSLHSSQWCHNECDAFSNHRNHDCLLNHLFRTRSKKTSKLHVTGLCEGNSLMTSEFPAQMPVTRRVFPFEDVIMSINEICSTGRSSYWQPPVPPLMTKLVSGQIADNLHHDNRHSIPLLMKGTTEEFVLLTALYSERFSCNVAMNSAFSFNCLLVGSGHLPGPWFNIKMSSYHYRKSYCGDKTVVRSSYLHNEISFTGKMTSLYWIRACRVLFSQFSGMRIFIIKIRQS